MKDQAAILQSQSASDCEAWRCRSIYRVVARCVLPHGGGSKIASNGSVNRLVAHLGTTPAYLAWPVRAGVGSIAPYAGDVLIRPELAPTQMVCLPLHAHGGQPPRKRRDGPDAARAAARARPAPAQAEGWLIVACSPDAVRASPRASGRKGSHPECGNPPITSLNGPPLNAAAQNIASLSRVCIRWPESTHGGAIETLACREDAALPGQASQRE